MYITHKCFLLTLIPPKHYKKKGGGGEILLSHTLAFRPNAGPAALMTDAQQDFSKHRTEPSRVTPESDYAMPK